MERFLRAGDDSNSTQVIQAFDNDPSTNPDEFSLAIPDVLTPIAMSLMPPPSCQLDTIYLRNLQLSAVIGPDAWNRPDKLQPIVLSLQLQVDTSSAGSSDDIRSTFSYGQICKDVTTKLDGKTFTSIDHLTSDLAGLADDWPGDTMKLQAIAPKGMLRVEGGFGRGFSLRRIETKTHGWKTRNWQVESHEWIVKGLKLACIIGVNPHERLEKQNLSLDISIQGEADVAEYTLQIKGGFETWRRLIKSVCDAVEKSSFETLEALCTLVAKTALEGFPIPRITVAIEKPSALTFVDGAGVQIVRDRQWLLKSEAESNVGQSPV